MHSVPSGSSSAVSFPLFFWNRNRTKKRNIDEKYNTGDNNTVWRTARGHCEGEIHPSQCTLTRSQHVFSQTAQHLFSSFFSLQMSKKDEEEKRKEQTPNTMEECDSFRSFCTGSKHMALFVETGWRCRFVPICSGPTDILGRVFWSTAGRLSHASL